MEDTSGVAKTETSSDDLPAGRFVDRLRPKLRMIGGAIASLAAVGAIASGLLGYWNVWKTVKTDVLQQAATSTSTATGQPIISRGPTVAVLPFENSTRDAALENLANGLADGIIDGLGRFGALRVLTRGAIAGYKGRTASAIDLSSSLGADYFVEGTLRSGSDSIRLTIQLSDAKSGARVWSKPFEINSQSGNYYLLALDEISGRASALIGSYFGAITAAEFAKIRAKPNTELTSYECIVQGVSINALVSPELARRARECLETLTQKEPANSAAWAALTWVYSFQKLWGVGLLLEQDTDSRKRDYLVPLALNAATNSVDLSPNDSFAHGALARAYYLSCHSNLLLVETQKAIDLNPHDPLLLGSLGVSIAFTGQWEVGVPMVEKAIGLTAPTTPVFWWWGPAKWAYARGEYAKALAGFQRSYVEHAWISHLDMAYTLPFLGRIEEAKAEIAKLQKLRPGFTIRDADIFYANGCFEPSFREKMVGALRKAGLPE